MTSMSSQHRQPKGVPTGGQFRPAGREESAVTVGASMPVGAPAPTGRSAYRPGHARPGEKTPQSHPEEFSVEDLKAEAKHLVGLNRRLGANTLRTLAYLDLLREIRSR